MPPAKLHAAAGLCLNSSAAVAGNIANLVEATRGSFGLFRAWLNGSQNSCPVIFRPAGPRGMLPVFWVILLYRKAGARP